MICFLNVGCRGSGRSLHPTPPTGRLGFPICSGRHFGKSVGRLAPGKLVETFEMRYALSAD